MAHRDTLAAGTARLDSTRQGSTRFSKARCGKVRLGRLLVALCYLSKPSNKFVLRLDCGLNHLIGCRIFGEAERR